MSKPRMVLNNGDEPQDPQEGVSNTLIIEKPQILETINNRIYFYSDVYRDTILRLNKTLAELDANIVFAKIQCEDPEYRPIFLHLNSYGGNVFDGLSAMDQICMSKAPVITIVDGICASAATFISVSGSKRFIKKNSFMLIHQLSSVMWGKFDEFADEMINLQKIMEVIKKIYHEKTKIPAKKLEEILKHDLYFDAPTCLKYGLVDEII